MVICILNSLIIHKVILARRNRQLLAGNSTSSPGTASRSRTRQGGGESSAKVTVMLLSISFTFLITTLPMNVTIITTAFSGSYAPTLALGTKFKLARTISELLMYTNHSINFFLYLLTGQKFRQQLVAMVCPSRHERCTSVYTQVAHIEAKGQNGIQKSAGQNTELAVFKNGTYARVSNESGDCL